MQDIKDRGNWEGGIVEECGNCFLLNCSVNLKLLLKIYFKSIIFHLGFRKTMNISVTFYY